MGFRNAIGTVKDQTSISLAKLASFSDLRVAIVKATCHKACPPKEHHIREILSLTSYSRQHAASCVATISRRLTNTKDWVVALKALMLIQRLMYQGNLVFEQEVFFATKNGTHLLDMSDFRDAAWSNSWDYSAFVRSYALFLAEQLDSRTQEREDQEDHLNAGEKLVKTTPVHEMHNKQIYTRTQRFMKLLDSFLACRPTGAAKNSRIVAMALYPLVKQSFQLYYDMTDTITVLQDRFTDLDIADSIKIFDIFCRVAKQYEELEVFYCWCNEACITRTSDYPEVNQISQKKLDVMDEFIKEKTETEQRMQDGESEPENEETNEPEPEPEPEPMPDLIELEPLLSTSGHDQEEKKEKKTQDIGDLLNLEDDTPTIEEHADKLALALFGSGSGTTNSAKRETNSAWEAFNESGDWEKALVETASQLSKQEPSLPGGFNTLLLDGMYQQGATQAAMVNSGSASSVAFGRPMTMLALPAGNGRSPDGDPFATSAGIAPPSYVQMSDMEKKQRLLMEEQMMWQQVYQGQVGMAYSQSHLQQMNQYPYYNMVGCTYQQY